MEDYDLGVISEIIRVSKADRATVSHNSDLSVTIRAEWDSCYKSFDLTLRVVDYNNARVMSNVIVCFGELSPALFYIVKFKVIKFIKGWLK